MLILRILLALQMTDKSLVLKAAYFTLGCKLNYAETSAIGKLLGEKGIIRVSKGESPDLCVVNTCSVTETADKKGRRLIRSLASRYPGVPIIVTGCYAQLKPQEVASLPGVEMVLGSNEKMRIAEFIDNWLSDRQKAVAVTPVKELKDFHPSCSQGDRTRYFLKVQDGCDYYCTYCTIPYARGHSRSGRITDLLEMARDVALKGGKEIVLTGINIGEFGKDHGEELLDLMKYLDEVEGIERYRISSIEPNLLTDGMINWIAKESKSFMPHFHLPLQSGSDKVLKLMNRRYDTGFFKSRVDFIRGLIPDAFIGVDIMAGARGETDEEWNKSLEFAREIDVTRYHVFPYSERPGTAALKLALPVEQAEKHRRVSLLTSLSDSKMEAFMKKVKGCKAKVLWEHSTGKDMMHGLTENYIRVAAPFVPELINKVSSVVLDEIMPEEPEVMTALHI